MNLVIPNQSGLVQVLLCVVLSAAAQVCLKAGMIDLNDVDWNGSMLGRLLHDRFMIAGLMWIIVGLSLYLASMLVWIRSLMSIDLSVAYSLLSLNYVLVYLVATQWSRIGETASLARTVGITVIVVGVMIVMSTSSARDAGMTNIE